MKPGLWKRWGVLGRSPRFGGASAQPVSRCCHVPASPEQEHHGQGCHVPALARSRSAGRAVPPSPGPGVQRRPPEML